MNINIIICYIMMLEHEECYHIDDFEYDEDLIEIKQQNEYAGFLHVSRTYGKSGKRFLYKVVPYNRELPQLLIPYDLKIDFSKNSKNKYILFTYDNLLECSQERHNTGKLIKTLGDADNLDAYYQYMLYGRNVKPILTKINKQMRTLDLNENFLNSIFNKYIQNNEDIITIDNHNSEYFDDALGFNNNKLSIYISNVCVWLEELNLWDYMSDEVKTIYLPRQRELMLPKNLTDLCSLKENKKSIVLRITVNNDEKIEITFETITVRKNFYFEEKELINDCVYQDLFNFTKQFTNITSSDQLVSYWMVFANTKIGDFLSQNGKGIFKKNIQKYNDEELEKMLREHEFSKDYYLLSGNYCQITSPIRRKADILNILFLMKKLGFIFNNGELYSNKWLSQLDKWNNNMKQIRRIENEAMLVDKIVSFNNRELTYYGKKLGDYIKINSLNKLIKYDYHGENNEIKLIIKIIECDERKRVLLEIV